MGQSRMVDEMNTPVISTLFEVSIRVRLYGILHKTNARMNAEQNMMNDIVSQAPNNMTELLSVYFFIIS